MDKLKPEDAFKEIGILRKEVSVLQATINGILSYFGGLQGMSEVCLNHLDLRLTVKRNKDMLNSQLAGQHKIFSTLNLQKKKQAVGIN
ncbi:hypothetical protein FGO68_gene9892 [Halteria grandinella]|uniref:Uncharacterized protein n=1 Tax=Halteria grandinella TaxID=5974 RepID=A0A8J8NPF4_HALGN|nr:hypothetical protein FGO68_gene9892 [Halteria grandinella]